MNTDRKTDKLHRFRANVDRRIGRAKDAAVDDPDDDGGDVEVPNPIAIPTVTPICLGQVNQGRWCQETYETASRHVAIRARALRKLGYRVTCSALGPQVTGLGLLKLTLVDIRPASVDGDTLDLPPVKIERTR